MLKNPKQTAPITSDMFISPNLDIVSENNPIVANTVELNIAESAMHLVFFFAKRLWVSTFVEASRQRTEMIRKVTVPSPLLMISRFLL